MKITIAREDCTLLYIALRDINGGLSPKNAIAAADNINVLFPVVSALDKGKAALQRAVARIQKDVSHRKITADDGDERTEKLADELITKQDEPVDLELIPLDITKDEIAEAKMKPAHLALVRRWLTAPKEG